jgi:hypothetical protein
MDRLERWMRVAERDEVRVVLANRTVEHEQELLAAELGCAARLVRDGLDLRKQAANELRLLRMPANFISEGVLVADVLVATTRACIYKVDWSALAWVRTAG